VHGIRDLAIIRQVTLGFLPAKEAHS
jgi:hypothetical protein